MRNLELQKMIPKRLQNTAFSTPRHVPGSTPGKTPMGGNNFPGQQFGATIEQVRTFIKEQKRIAGYDFNVDTGDQREDLQISGTARMLLGIAVLLEGAEVLAGTEVTQMTLVLNSEIIIKELSPVFLSPDFCDDEYYFIPRPLSGSDELYINFTNDNLAQRVRVALYYL